MKVEVRCNIAGAKLQPIFNPRNVYFYECLQLTSQKAEIANLKSAVARQQQEIEALKASHITPQKPQVPQQTRISVEKLLKEVKRVCDEAILANYNHLPTMFADKQELKTFRKSADQKFLSVDIFNTYKKAQETRLKSIEEKLTRRFSLFSTNRRNQPRDQPRKASFSITTIIQFFKNHNPQGFISLLIFVLIWLLAFYLINSITL